MSAPQNTPARDSLSPWARRVGGVIFFVFALIAAGIVLDVFFYTAPHAGFIPDDTQFVMHTAPTLLDSMQHTRVVQAMRSEASLQVHEATLSLRQKTGLRYTPARLRLWLGQHLILWQREGEWGGCCYPGPLLRSIHALRRLFGATAEEGIYRYNDLYYAWREGFCLVADSPEGLRAALEGARFQRAAQQKRAASYVELLHHGTTQACLLLEPGESLSFRGIVFYTPPEALESEKLPAWWGDPPLLSVSGNAPELLEAAWDSTEAQLPPMLQPLLDQLRSAWQPETWPMAWWRDAETYAIGIPEVDLETTIPVPAITMAVKHDGAAMDALESALKKHQAIPAAWGAYTGYQFPVFGEKATLCMGRHEHHVLFASREALMPSLVEHFQPETSGHEGVLAVSLDCTRTSSVVQAIVKNLAEAQLLGTMSDNDVERNWTPLCNAFGVLGQVDIIVEPNPGSGLRFRGYCTPAVPPEGTP